MFDDNLNKNHPFDDNIYGDNDMHDVMYDDNMDVDDNIYGDNDMHDVMYDDNRNVDNDIIKSSIKETPRITIRELSEDLDISFGTCQTIIKNDLHLKRSPAKFVPHLLTNEQKEHRKET
ncbi:hypothetical protein LAZ67_4002152 [Cordylochernes scorpioides]|uniref:Uncharacterized protein n=1 Tax=Cordylochernes scorpioides TaxID=51811 RepID=A0ABY6KFY9_9ARAC|nr:hypothetical protein LAZ67_4002152 [Cordylochernes scorpioides]